MVGDTFGTATAVADRPTPAVTRCRESRWVTHRCRGTWSADRAPLNRELWEAMAQLMGQDATSFVRYGITQLTQGAYDEEVAQQRSSAPPAELEATWAMIRDSREPSIGEAADRDRRPAAAGQARGLPDVHGRWLRGRTRRIPRCANGGGRQGAERRRGLRSGAARVLRPVAQGDTKRAMSHENVEVVRCGSDAWNRGDVDEWLAFFAPEAEWHMSPAPPPTPSSLGAWRASA